MIERRSRGAVAPTLATNGGNAVAPAGVVMGRQARAISEMEHTKQAERQSLRAQGANWDDYNRRRFYLSSPGDQADVIILDKDIDSLGFVYEHNMPQQDAQGRQIVNERTQKPRYGAFETCPTETNLCPLCLKGSHYSAYNMHMTVLDLRGYNSERLGRVEHVKRPLVIPSNLHPVFFKMLDQAMEKHGTIRGMQIMLERDNYDKSAGCGRPQEIDGSFYVMIPENEIMASFSHEAIMADDNETTIKPKNFDVVPFDYMKTIPRPDAAYLRQKYNLSGGTSPSSDTEANWSGARTNANAQNTNNRAALPRARSRSAMTAPAVQEVATVVEDTQEVATPQVAASSRVRSRPSVATPPSAPVAAQQIVRRATSGPVNEIDKDIPFD